MAKPGQAIIKGVEKTTAKWAKQRRAEERHLAATVYRESRVTQSHMVTFWDVAQEVMESAYLHASGGGTLPTLARQVMYAARPEIEAGTGQKLDDNYFTQNLLPRYIREYQVEHWDVVFDARGHLEEPHTQRVVALGTLDVGRYIDDVAGGDPKPSKLRASETYKTIGPENRYGALLFVEKEGFMPLIKASHIAERFDIAVMSSKGMQSTACRRAADELCGEYDIPLLVMHDFDKAGFSMLGMFSHSNERYAYNTDFEVIDIGLRLADVTGWNLSPEAAPVLNYRGRRNLQRNGATPAEVEFIAAGQRVELNVFTSDQLVAWLEQKLEHNGVEKIVPDADTLAAAWRQMIIAGETNRRIKAVEAEVEQIADAHPMPDDVANQIEKSLAATPHLSWDQAIAHLATAPRGDSDPPPAGVR